MSKASQTVERDVVIQNREGLHARPVMRFVELAQHFTAEIQVSRLQPPTGEIVDGKSPMSLMLLCATHGTRLRIRATGADAEAAVEALAKLVANRFDLGT